MFKNREEAGLLLAEKLKTYKDKKDTLVLAIPRGGVVVGSKIAENLNLPLSIIAVKKLGAPHNQELAIGAIALDGTKVVDWDLVSRLGIEQGYLDEEIKRKKEELEEREKKYQISNIKNSHPSSIHDAVMRNNLQTASGQISKKKVVILIDDGIATGATVLAAIKGVKQQSTINNQSHPSSIHDAVMRNNLQTASGQLTIILAVPVIANDAYDRIESEVDELVALEIPEFFGAVGEFYREFPQVSDNDVIKLLSHQAIKPQNK